MRTRFALTILSLVALLAVVGSSVPTASHAAPALQPSRQELITGTLVATPQQTLPTMLLLQVGGQTIPVNITAATQIIDSANHALSLSSLHNGDTLQVIGNPNVTGGIDGLVVQDLTTPVTLPQPTYPLTVKGVLASVPSTSLVCLANAGVLGNGLRPQVAVVSPCPVGQLPVYLTGATQFLGPNSQVFTLGMLQIRDTLLANGSVSNTQFTAATVQDLTNHNVPPPAYPLTVQGMLASVPSTSLMCLANASVLGNGLRPQVAVVSPCPVGQLPVYLTGATQFLGPSGQAFTLGMLQIGDTLSVNGLVSNTRFTAAMVKDLTSRVIRLSYSTVVGTVQYISPFTNGVYFTLRVQKGNLLPRGTIASQPFVIPRNLVVTVYVQNNTQIVVHGVTTNQVTALNPGQLVTVVGVYNAQTHRVSPTLRVTVH